MSPPDVREGASGEPTPDDTSAPSNTDPVPTTEPVGADCTAHGQPVLPLQLGPAPTVTDDPVELLEKPGVDPLWRAHGWVLIEARAATGVPFSTDELRADGLGEPAHQNHWGSLIGSAARAAIIRPIGAGRSARRSRAGGWRLLWVGTPEFRRGAA